MKHPIHLKRPLASALLAWMIAALLFQQYAGFAHDLWHGAAHSTSLAANHGANSAASHSDEHASPSGDDRRGPVDFGRFHTCVQYHGATLSPFVCSTPLLPEALRVSLAPSQASEPRLWQPTLRLAFLSRAPPLN